MQPALSPLLGLVLASLLPAQGPPPNGPRPVDPGWHALVGADLVQAPGRRIANATVVIRDGRIVAVAADAPAPAGARVWDCKGLTLYPGFIESWLPVDAPAPDAGAPGTHWNQSVLAQRSALDGPGAAEKDRQSLRQLGFAAAAIAPTGGVFKGSAAVVLLEEPRPTETQRPLRRRAYHLLSFQGSGSYPGSQMGAIALLRQTLADADWRQRCRATMAVRPELGPMAADAVGDALADRDAPLVFETQDELEILRAHKLAAEFERRAFVLGSGMEFRRLKALAKTGMPVVVPLDMPEVPDVASIAKAERVALRQLASWEQAPTNTKRLLDAGVTVAWTSGRLKDRQQFRQRVADAMALGITADQALAMLTTVPARLLGVEDRLGTVEVGKVANLVAVRGDWFDPKSKVTTVWVGGQPHEIVANPEQPADGIWSAELALATATTGELHIAGNLVELRVGEATMKARKVQVSESQLDFLLADKGLGQEGQHTLHAVRDGDRLHGTGRTPDGQAFTWTAARSKPLAKEESEEQQPPLPSLDLLPTPFEAYGLRELPQPQSAVFSGCTLWTSGPQGIIERAALWIRNGKIAFAGPATSLPELPTGTAVIDATGKHITPGIIDCHSHTGISRGVNEGGQAVTSEVRIQDVVDPNDINWYRQLAGGVTTVNQLHGSANAIGGQSWVVKLRWGVEHPDEMSFAGSKPGIKFALGENPRRANSSENDRYPNTRMGVEALIRDRFTAAADYRRTWDRYEALDGRGRAAVLPPRRDLELEAVAEILAGNRWIHCHSYRQDEIFMLCRMADEFRFRIGTFQHVLEGYKVADEIARAAVGASGFSDWWAYKLEVYDAIPENGAILREQGVCVSFNSDSSELARRLNTEAGKAVKYGAVPPAEALKFVTLNPAIQLGIADRVGSLERGKDADFAVWSGDPLSYISRCEMTYIDGCPWFTLERDQLLRESVQQERTRLIQLALAAAGSAKPDGAERERKGLDAFWRAEDLTEVYCCAECSNGGGR